MFQVIFTLIAVVGASVHLALSPKHAAGRKPPERNDFLDTADIIDTGGNTKSSTAKTTRPGQPGCAKYCLSKILRKMFFENGTFHQSPAEVRT